MKRIIAIITLFLSIITFTACHKSDYDAHKYYYLLNRSGLIALWDEHTLRYAYDVYNGKHLDIDEVVYYSTNNSLSIRGRCDNELNNKDEKYLIEYGLLKGLDNLAVKPEREPYYSNDSSGSEGLTEIRQRFMITYNGIETSDIEHLSFLAEGEKIELKLDKTAKGKMSPEGVGKVVKCDGYDILTTSVDNGTLATIINHDSFFQDYVFNWSTEYKTYNEKLILIPIGKAVNDIKLSITSTVKSKGYTKISEGTKISLPMDGCVTIEDYSVNNNVATFKCVLSKNLKESNFNINTIVLLKTDKGLEHIEEDRENGPPENRFIVPCDKSGNCSIGIEVRNVIIEL